MNMPTDDLPAIIVTTADRRGSPLHAICTCGGWEWQQPQDDGWGDTLSHAAGEHRREHDRRGRETLT
jgi:hypothetical protein